MLKKISILMVAMNIFFAQASGEYEQLMSKRAISEISKFDPLFKPEMISTDPLTVKIDIYEPERNLDENIRNNVLYAAFDAIFVAFSQSNIDEIHLNVNVEWLKGVKFDENNYSYSELRAIENRLKGFNKTFIVTRKSLNDFLRKNNVIVISSIINKNGYPDKDYERLKFGSGMKFLNENRL